MTAFYLALVVGTVVAIVYVALAGRAFWRVRTQVLAPQPTTVDTESDAGYAAQGRGFAWKATGGVVASTLILVGVSITPAAWYLLPFLAIGSSVAVVVAFLVDRRS